MSGISAKGRAYLALLLLFAFGGASASALVPPVSVGIGIGLPEYVNASVRLAPSLRNQIGITVGGFPYADSSLFGSVDLEHYLHIGRITNELPPWYLRTGLSYMFDHGPFERSEVLALKLALGMEFRPERYNFIGVDVDGGFAIALVRKDSTIREGPWLLIRPIDFGAITMRIQLFGRRYE
jgi:hypothetical protein